MLPHVFIGSQQGAEDNTNMFNTLGGFSTTVCFPEAIAEEGLGFHMAVTWRRLRIQSELSELVSDG